MKYHFILPLLLLLISVNAHGQETYDSIPKVIRNTMYQLSGGAPCNLTMHVKTHEEPSYDDTYQISFNYNFTKNLMPPGLRNWKTKFSNPGQEVIQRFADSIPYTVVNDSNTGYKILKGIEFFSNKSDSIANCDVEIAINRVIKITCRVSDSINHFEFELGSLGDVENISIDVNEYSFTAHFDTSGNYLLWKTSNDMEERTDYNNFLTGRDASVKTKWIPLKIKNYLLKNYPKCSFHVSTMLTKTEVKEIHVETYKKGRRATLVFDNNGNFISQTEFEKLRRRDYGWR